MELYFIIAKSVLGGVLWRASSQVGQRAWAQKAATSAPEIDRKIVFPGWVWVESLIDASFDFVFISGGFGFRTCSILAPFWVQFGTILVPFWIHFGSIWGPFWVHLGSLEGSCGGKASK